MVKAYGRAGLGAVFVLGPSLAASSTEFDPGLPQHPDHEAKRLPVGRLWSRSFWLGSSSVYDVVMTAAAAAFDYHGALIVVETADDEIVFIHPPGGSPEAPASLPSNPCDPGETPQDAAVRMVREMTGLKVRIVREFVTFIQEGTPTGTMFAHCYIAHVAGGTLTHDGPEGPARVYPLDALPAIMPIRVANKRALDAYLKQRGGA